MNSKTISFAAVFAAFTVALNLSPIKIPAPYAPFLIYQIWEIPIVASFLLFGPKTGAAVALLNTVILLAVFPGALPTGPFYNLAAVLSMLLGVYIALRLVQKISILRSEIRVVACVTSFGIILRVGVMTLVNWLMLPYPPPVGYSLPQVLVMAWIPLIGIFNFTLALYTVPLGHFLVRVAEMSTKIVAWNQVFVEKSSRSSKGQSNA